MKQRIVKKVERRMLVDKVCELQREIDEHDRFLGDLMLMLVKNNPDHMVLKYAFTTNDYANFIWKKAQELIKENAELREKSRSGDQPD